VSAELDQAGEWVVDETCTCDTDEPMVYIQQTLMGVDGVESFETAMFPADALAFGEAIVKQARDLM
jgi:hypothetical protein